MPKRLRFVQARLADLRAASPKLMPAPRSLLLYDASAPDGAPPHTIDASVISGLGLRLESRYRLARGTDGEPHLWMERRRMPMQMGPARGFQFDRTRPDTSAAEKSTPFDVSAEIESAHITREAAGLSRIVVRVSVHNTGSRRTGPALVAAQIGDTPFWEHVVHRPIHVAGIEPDQRTALELTALVVDMGLVPASKLRVLLIPSTGPASNVVYTETQIDLVPPEPSAVLRMEALGPPSNDGARTSVPVRVTSTDRTVDARVAEYQLQPSNALVWRVAPHFHATSAAIDSVIGALSWNHGQMGRTPSVRVIVAPPASAEVHVSDAVAVDAGDLMGMPASAFTSFAIHDTQPSATGVDALGVLTIENTGEADLDRLTVSFAQRNPTAAAWEPLSHEQPSAHIGVASGDTIAVPVLIAANLPDSGLMLLRCLIQHDVEKIATSSFGWRLINSSS